jgi:hypothetical protein
VELGRAGAVAAHEADPLGARAHVGDEFVATRTACRSLKIEPDRPFVREGRRPEAGYTDQETETRGFHALGS